MTCIGSILSYTASVLIFVLQIEASSASFYDFLSSHGSNRGHGGLDWWGDRTTLLRRSLLRASLNEVSLKRESKHGHGYGHIYLQEGMTATLKTSSCDSEGVPGDDNAVLVLNPCKTEPNSPQCIFESAKNYTLKIDFEPVRELVSPRIEVSLILPQNKSQQQLEQAPGLAIGEEWGEEVALGVTEEGLVCEGGMLSYGKCPLMPRYVYEIKTMLTVPLLSIVITEEVKLAIRITGLKKNPEVVDDTTSDGEIEPAREEVMCLQAKVQLSNPLEQYLLQHSFTQLPILPSDPILNAEIESGEK